MAKQQRRKDKTPPKRKNVSQKIRNGTTLQTRDEFLASGKGKQNIKPDHPSKKDLYRRVAVLDSNRNDELLVVKLDTKGRHELKDYLTGKSKYKAFVEIEDEKGNRIVIDDVRFAKNSQKRYLTKSQVDRIKKDCLTNKETSKSLRKENSKKFRTIKGR